MSKSTSTSAPRQRRRHVTPPGATPPPAAPRRAAKPAIAPPVEWDPSRTRMAGNSRIQVPATDEQKTLLKRAADAAGFGNVRATGGMGAYIANRVLVVAAAELAGEAPLVLGAKVAADAKALAAAEGCTSDDLIAKSLDMLRAVRASASR
jgi:hypothetical protein